MPIWSYLGRAVVALAFALGTTHVAAAQQESGPSVAMVVGDPANLASWGFAPTVPVGQAVTWTNVGFAPHTVTFEGVGWDTGIIAPGAAGTLVFDAPGLYAYLCALHPSMVGTLAVSDDLAVAVPTMSIVEPDPADVASWGYAVSVQAGQSVVWSNADAQPHTATAPDFAWDTGSLNAGEASALPFDSPGLFVYTCLPHPWMKGFLEVRPSD